MEEKLPPEIKELVDKVLSEHKAVKELSVEDLEGVAGGVPETFVVNGGSVNPKSDLIEGQRVRIKYHPKNKTNARLVE